MTEAQKRTVDRIVNECYERDREFHHGDGIGADVEAVEIAHVADYRIIVHPPAACTKRAFTPGDVIESAKPYWDWNRDIVHRAHLLSATPKGHCEDRRSGTWATVRDARQRGIPVLIIRPDGSVI